MNKHAGQSTIEFILTFAFGVSVILVIFNSAMNYTTGYLVHYATYMASRTYLTADNSLGTIGNSSPSLNGAEEKARATFSKYTLTVFKIPSSNLRINPPSTNPAEQLTVGAYTTFEQSVDAVGKVAGAAKLELVSESFLGKEPTRSECATRVCRAMTGESTCGPELDVTLFDDGC